MDLELIEGEVHCRVLIALWESQEGLEEGVLLGGEGGRVEDLDRII